MTKPAAVLFKKSLGNQTLTETFLFSRQCENALF